MKFFLAVLLACSVGMPRTNAQHDVKVSGSLAGAAYVIDTYLALRTGNDFLMYEGHVIGTYEYVIRKNMGVLISGTYVQFIESHDYYAGVVDLDYSGFRITPEFRCYFRPGDHNATGFFAGAFLTYRNTRESIISEIYSIEIIINEFRQTAHNVGAGITAGFKFVANSGFIFEVAAGYGHHFMNSRQYLTNSDPDPAVLPINNFGLALNIGWRFGDESRSKENEDR